LRYHAPFESGMERHLAGVLAWATRRFAWAAAAFSALALSACASNLGPSQAELRAKWDAQNVLPQNYKADLLAYFRTYLNNPEGVRRAEVSAPMLKEVGPGERYVVCVRFNARDTRGKYLGAKEAVAVFVSGKLDRLAERVRERPRAEDEVPGAVDGPRAPRELCKDASFAPFPELEALRR
jgi:hypothetical protein